MNLTKEITNFMQKEYTKNLVIEPEYRLKELKEHILDIISMYKPQVIIKIGLGNSSLLSDLVKETKAYYVVVEPYLDAILDFEKKHEQTDFASELRFINGNFHDLPVDYYSADLLICNDILDFTDSGKAIDEFRRVLNFDAILMLSMVVLAETDLNGSYDEFMGTLFPIHNDFYMDNDLKTVIELNEFDFIKGSLTRYSIDLQEKIKFFQEAYNIDETTVANSVEKHRQALESFYSYDNNTIQEPYYTGVFRRKKPDDSMKGKIV